MPIPEKYTADFVAGDFYHVYNRTNNKELLFLTDDNRMFFLKRFKEILSPFLETYCWCLLPNHFHILVRIKPENQIISFIDQTSYVARTAAERKFHDQLTTVNDLVIHEFKRFFQSYSLSFNKIHKRKGNLFYKSFKRVLIEKDSQLTMALVYIHANAMKHNIVKDFMDYPWSSWQSIVSLGPTSLARTEVIDWFGSLQECIKVHKTLSKYYYDCEISLED